MNLALSALSSGSNGNCYLVKSNTTALLVDAGISARQTGLRLANCDVKIEDISAILLTHEHSDHTVGIPALIKNENIKLYTNRRTKTMLGFEVPEEKIVLFETGDSFQIGDIEVTAFHNSHDAADPVGFRFSQGGSVITIVTDTGYVTDQAIENMLDANLLVLESNHDENILKVGRYPWFLKQRILGEKGHLSNDAAAAALLRILTSGNELKLKTVLLAHLSAENNFPEMALQTVKNILEAALPELSAQIKVEVLLRGEQSPLHEV